MPCPIANSYGSVEVMRLQKYATNASELLNSVLMWRGGPGPTTTQQLEPALKALAQGAPNRLAEGLEFGQVYSSIRRAQSSSFISAVDKAVSRIRLAAWMSLNKVPTKLQLMNEYSHKLSRARGKPEKEEVSACKERALRKLDDQLRSCVVACGLAANSRETHRMGREHLRGLRLQELVAEFGLGILTIKPENLGLRSDNLRDWSDKRYKPHVAGLRANTTFQHFAAAMTDAFKEIIMPSVPETTPILRLEASMESNAEPTTSNILSLTTAVSKLRAFTVQPTAAMLQIASATSQPLPFQAGELD